ncbi:hypothetical protein [Aurantivibrio plasticivorans]
MIFPYVKRPYLFPLLIGLSACGGGGGNSGSGNLVANPNEPTVIEVSAFEGSRIEIDLGIDATDVEWQQLSGPTIIIDPISDGIYQLTIPWVLTENVVAEFEVQPVGATDDSEMDIVVVTLLNRHYAVFQVDDTVSEGESLYLQYFSTATNSLVPSNNIISLATAPEGMEICSFRISPSGQHVAYNINEPGGLLDTSCDALYMVDIESLEITDVSPQNIDGNGALTRNINWSPNSEKIAYLGDFGEGELQHYVYDLSANSTSYLNYGSNDLSSGFWPENDLYPIIGGGNPYGVELIDDPDTSRLTWLGNNNGVALEVYHSNDGENHTYIASVHGDTNWLFRDFSLIEYRDFLTDEEFTDHSDARQECTSDAPDYGTCALYPKFNVPLVLMDNTIIAPHSHDTSVAGHYSFIGQIERNGGAIDHVLLVSRPVIDLEEIDTFPSIEAEQVLAAAWSPTEPHLAFASENTERHRHTNNPDAALGQLLGDEIPGQLYIYHNYQKGHELPQERLAYPRPLIDDYFVQNLQWSNSGDEIAYVRGLTPAMSDFDYYTSLWVTTIDDVFDESTATIDNNTTLLINLRNELNYITDFMWTPDGEGILALVQNVSALDGSIEFASVEYFSKDGSNTYTLMNLDVDNVRKFYTINPSFSPDGQYLAYRDNDTEVAYDSKALYIRSLDGTVTTRVSVPLLETGFLREYWWSPSSNALIYEARISAIDPLQFFLGEFDGENQALHELFSVNETIDNVEVH